MLSHLWVMVLQYGQPKPPTPVTYRSANTMDFLYQPKRNLLARHLPFRSAMSEETTTNDLGDVNASLDKPQEHMNLRWWSRKTYSRTLVVNLATFFLPALYSTLSKLWVAQIDSASVVTTDAYTYIGIFAEMLNEGLPRAAYLVIGDSTNLLFSERLVLSTTLVTVQMVAGLLLSIIILVAAPAFAASFVPAEVRAASVSYVRISAFSTLFSATEYAVSTATRSLDRPDVPLVFSLSKTTANIILDMIFLSTFRAGTTHPTVNTQGIIHLTCDGVGAAAGLIFFIVTVFRHHRSDSATTTRRPIIRLSALKSLAKPGAFTFFESVVRNVLYLWLVSGVVAMGSDYATAWGVFNTIRWGVVMVPVSALEATSAAFTGHAWGVWNSRPNDTANPDQDKKALWTVMKPAMLSTAIALVVEAIIAIVLSLWLIQPFAYYLTGSAVTADITAYMWRTIDWTYICYATSTQLATILLATRPRWYFLNSLFVNILWVLPWAIAVTRIGITEETAWRYHSVIFGGSMVVSWVVIIVTIFLWRRSVLKTKRD